MIREILLPAVLLNVLSILWLLIVVQGPDILVSSLSKVFNGVGNAMGGSLILNKSSPLYAQMRGAMDEQYECNLYQEDADVLLSNSSDVQTRCKLISGTTKTLVTFLRGHPEVATVHAADTPDGEVCGLISIILRQPHTAPLFYDNLNIAKGPGFGTNFTLACPYTVLAHYDELEWCKQCGVEPSLVRVWVGLDPIEHLLEIFSLALDKSSCMTKLTRH